MKTLIDEATATVPQLDATFENRLPTAVLTEFRRSAVSDRLTLANIQWVEGEEAVLLLAETAMNQSQSSTSYVTKAAARIRDRYEFAATGGWVTYGTSLDECHELVPYFKPSQPRQTNESSGFGELKKNKVIKYETPAGCPALPILPDVDQETARAIYARYKFEPLAHETFWQAVQRANVPVAITEGIKKALALITHGIPAIAARGITQWREKGTDDLHPIIAQLIGSGRTVFIAFDQDEKLKTQINTRKQATKLGIALKRHGCEPRYITWDHSLGKGIDDVLYQHGDNAQTWMDVNLIDAKDIWQYRHEGMKAAALKSIKQCATSMFPLERFTEGEYIPVLPSLQQGAVHVLNANMNAGKTTRIGQDWVAEARQHGWFTIVLAPLNSLGEQTAEAWEFPHIHDFGTNPEQQSLLWSLVNQSQGIVMCPDSLHRLPSWILEKSILFILDEGNQVIKHMAEGNTLGDRWSEILERFSSIAHHAIQTGAIVLSEDGLPDRAINFTQRISSAATVRSFRHIKRGATWNCNIILGHVSSFRGQLLQVVQKGNRVLFVTTSQRECRRLERVLSKIAPNLKVVRIDRQTNQCGAFRDFFKDPDVWIQSNQPDVLIFSPSVKSGISIQGNIAVENAHFNSVWGYFPSLDTDSQMQLLGRYRPAVPRVIFIPPFIQTTGEESLYKPRAIMRQLQQNAAIMNEVYGVATLVEGRSDRHLGIEAAVQEYIAEQQAIVGAQKMIARDALIDRLQTAGHSVETEIATKCPNAITLWQRATEEIWQQDSEEGAAAVVDPVINTVEWAHKINNALESTHMDRVIASKVLLRDEFPGISFDDPQEWYEAIHKDYGAMKRGVRLQVRAENIEGSKERDRDTVSLILSANIRALHRLPKRHIQALLLQKIGILDLLDGKPYDDSDSRAIAIKNAALQYAKAIDYWLRLTITTYQGPIEICNKLLKKIGLTVEQKDRQGNIKREGDIKRNRPGGRGGQHYLYRVEFDVNSVRSRLLEAARSKISGAVSMICISERSPDIQIMDTKETHTPNTEEGIAGEPEIVPFLEGASPTGFIYDQDALAG